MPADVHDLKAEDVMTRGKLPPMQLPTVLTTSSIREAVERFCRSGRHKLLVLDAEGKLSGVLTPIDLMAWRAAETAGRSERK